MAAASPVDRQTVETIATVTAFGEAINSHDVDAVMALTTDDVVWETTAPPDGERIAGRAAVRTAIEAFLGSSPNAVFEEEEVVALGDRAFVTWVYRWVDAEGKSGHVRGVDLLRVRDGKVAETLAYVKG